ncbi:hypothetical protein FJZ40_01320 [Candidatus Shapirobacteria bacterium]|nr:hypothetical protein [Candidatus Shapirobacteria bacterium]
MKQGKDKLWMSGILAGILPHTFCILFVLLSIIGATTATVFLKPLLLHKNFFYFLILLSFAFATLSASLYLAKNGILSLAGLKRKWQYLGLLYGLTVIINLFLFLFIFPATANFNRQTAGTLSAPNQIKEIALKVEIPCSGHASLITEELKKNKGVQGVAFELPNIFRITYETTITNHDEILGLEIFKSFKPSILP